MRSIINISLPPSIADEIQKEVKSGQFASTSEFFRYLWRLWKEEKIAHQIKQSEKDFSKGNFKILKSLKDLR
jgi:Arc/MetJ-type ribon-helix-helix transcriptional regulator